MVNTKKQQVMNYLLTALTTMLMSSCSKENIWKDDELSIQKTPYTGNQLRTDGYYYENWGDPQRSRIYFIYNNGVLLGGQSPLTTEVEKREQEFQNGEYYNVIKDIKYSWGVFLIEGNQIKFERWYPGDPPLKAFVRAGYIVNDTTFVINESYRMQDGEKTNVETKNETYHFKQFSPKPDSTNEFIK